eukprot:8162285-Alexandrium_andersonii.AAC.1
MPHTAGTVNWLKQALAVESVGSMAGCKSVSVKCARIAPRTMPLSGANLMSPSCNASSRTQNMPRP